MPDLNDPFDMYENFRECVVRYNALERNLSPASPDLYHRLAEAFEEEGIEGAFYLWRDALKHAAEHETR